jgi:hypothetical protein
MGQTTASPVKRTTGAPSKRGKKRSGWTMVGVYLSPEATTRLMLAQIAKGVDRSTIVDNLVLSHLDHYVFQTRKALPVAELPDDSANFTAPGHSPGSASQGDGVNPTEATAA